MKRLNPKISAALEFVRRERIYFLILLFTLALLVLNQNQPDFSEPLSPAVNQLEQASRAWGESGEGILAWVQLVHTRPTAVFACAGIIMLFAGLFLGGLVILISVAMIPRFYRWFQNAVPRSPGPAWTPVLFFRVLILIFSFMASSAILMETFFGINGADENEIGLFHTLFIDIFACLSVLAVLKTDDMIRGPVIEKPAVSQWGEIKRGLTVYTAAFPIFISGLFLVLGTVAGAVVGLAGRGRRSVQGGEHGDVAGDRTE